MGIRFTKKDRVKTLSEEERGIEELSDLDIFITLLRKNEESRLEKLKTISGKTKSKLRTDLKLNNI